MSITGVILTILILGVLIFIHEFGHFLFAKKNGVKVVEFSIGMGPRLFSFGKGETKYSLKCLPFGGSCQMLGFDEEEENNERAFCNKSVWARMSISFAGPLFNVLLAFVIALVLISLVGFDPARVISVRSDSNVYKAGLREGDVITEFNGVDIDIAREIGFEELRNPIDENTITLTYERDGEEYEISYSPDFVKKYLLGIRYTASQTTDAIISEVTEDGACAEVGIVAGDIIKEINGVTIDKSIDLAEYFDLHPLTAEQITLKYEHEGTIKTASITPKYSTEFYDTGFVYNQSREKTDALGVIKYSIVEIKYQIVSVVKSLGMLFTGKLTANDLSGPVGITEIVNDTYKASMEDGIYYLLLNMMNITLLLSANLGVMNLLPIPGLDGGKLIFLIVEAIRRKPIAKEKEGIIQLVGMLLLFLLAIFVLFNDIKKLF